MEIEIAFAWRSIHCYRHREIHNGNAHLVQQKSRGFASPQNMSIGSLDRLPSGNQSVYCFLIDETRKWYAHEFHEAHPLNTMRDTLRFISDVKQTLCRIWITFDLIKCNKSSRGLTFYAIWFTSNFMYVVNQSAVGAVRRLHSSVK